MKVQLGISGLCIWVHNGAKLTIKANGIEIKTNPLPSGKLREFCQVEIINLVSGDTKDC